MCKTLEADVKSKGLYIAYFHRGSGHCRDEEFRLVFAETKKEAQCLMNQYKEKFFNELWFVDIKDLEFDDDENSVCITSYYS